MYALLFDANLCVGCEECIAACRKENEQPGEAGSELSATDFTVLKETGDVYVRQMCRHCVDPSCASACPVGALRKTAAGPVIYDFDRCLGCRYCMVACPFGIPRYEWSSPTPRVRKCQMCPQRLEQGKPTACAEACPAEATIFGERLELIAEAWRRISAEPDTYAPRVYGLEEAGGTCVLLIGPQAMMDSFDPRIPAESLPKKTWAVLSQIPTAVGVAAAGLMGVSWVIHRRIQLEEEAARQPSLPDEEESR